jgi:organic hydroperoxide reductase OsmC/OhrA
MTTFLSIAEFSKLEFKSFSCEAKGVLDTVEGKLLMTEVHLKPTVVIADESLREKAEKILHKSEAACLISNSVKAKVTMTPNIIVQ